ncbi:WD40-repeat-containing domain protein [Suillus ampliporus]|nr:WD40-repeat-containing domain protein [Suillus ampliporus]
MLWSVCWSPNGELVLSGSFDGTARAWDVKSGETVLGPIETGHEHVEVVIYSPDSTKFATGGYNENGAKIWNAKTGELLATLKHSNKVLSLTWTSDGNKLISGSYCLVRIFDTTTWEQIATLDGHIFHVNDISLFPNDRLLASASSDSTVRLWNLDTNLPVGPLLRHEDCISCAAFSADGTVLVTGCDDKNTYVWDVYAILEEAGLEDLLSIPDASVNITALSRRRALVPSLGSPTALLARLSSLFHRPQINARAATSPQQRPRRSIHPHHRPPRVDVAAVRDRQALFVARRPERDKPKPAQQPQHQPQASTSQTPTASTSTTPPAPATSIATPSAAITQPRRPIPLWARLVLFICCASPPDSNGH